MKVCFTGMIALVCASVSAASAAAERLVLDGYSDDTARVVAGEFTPELQRRFYDVAVAIAQKKMWEGVQRLRDNPPKRKVHPRISTGGGFGGFFMWDTCFCVEWAKYEPVLFPVFGSLDNFYELQDEDGFICREFTYDGVACWAKEHPFSWNPPLLSWAEWDLYKFGLSDKSRLERVFPALRKFYLCCERMFRRDDGLYFGDMLGGGMDDLPRFPKKPWRREDGISVKREHLICYGDWFDRTQREDAFHLNRQIGWVDMTAQMALNALSLARIAGAIGRSDDVKFFKAKHSELVRLINEKCWDEERGFYFDCYEGEIIPRYTVAGFWPLLAEAVPPSRVKRLVDALNDERIFRRPCGVCALGACEEGYDPEWGYWRGAVWPPTTYMVLRGLKACGRMDAARELAHRYYNANLNLFLKTGTVWENISSEQCALPKHAAAMDFTGWGALAPIAIYNEFIKPEGEEERR